MDTLKLSASDFTAGKYNHNAGVLEYAGHVEVAADLRRVQFTRINVAGRLVAQAGTGIQAGGGIEAGWHIKAGTGIQAGKGIHCKLDLSAKLRIFAGLINWRLPTADEQRIECRRLINGTIALGTLCETAM